MRVEMVGEPGRLMSLGTAIGSPGVRILSRLLLACLLAFPALAQPKGGSEQNPYGLPNLPNSLAQLDAKGRLAALDYVNARDAQWGCFADNSHDDGPCLTSASAYASATGRSLYIPDGEYRVTSFGVSPGKTFGQGNSTVINCDDTGPSPPVACIYNYVPGADYDLSDFMVFGRAASVPVQGAHAVEMLNAGNVRWTQLNVQYSRQIGLFCLHCTSLVATSNTVYRSLTDGLDAWDTPNAIITVNNILQSNDDGISAHSNDSAAAPVRSGVIIADNTLEESQGINVLGAKTVRVTGNTLRRVRSYGIRVDADATFSQGNTPGFAVEIAGNMLADVIGRAEPNPRNPPYAYMLLSGGPRHGASGGTGVPGYPSTALTGAINDLFGSNSAGTLYANATTATNMATPGGGFFDVHDNVLVRTLPATTSWGQWGYGSNIWVGNNGDGTGLYSGGEPEAMLELDCIRITGPLSHSKIHDNFCRTTGNYGIAFYQTNGPGATVIAADFDYDGLEITRNQIADFNNVGIAWNQSSARSNQNISITDNDIDGDPRFRNGARGGGGTWASSGAILAFNLPFLSSTGELSRNRIRNVATPLNINGGGILKFANVVYGHGTQGGFSTSNAGVGLLPATSSAWTQVDTDGNPASATFGDLLTFPSP